MDTTVVETGAGSSSTSPDSTTSPAPDFVTETGAKLDAAFAAMDRGESAPNPSRTVEPPSDNYDARRKIAAKDGDLPSGDIVPPEDKLNPLEPDSDEALEREIAAKTGAMGKKERDAFSKLRYEARDFKRSSKEVPSLRAKITELEAKGSTNPALEAKIQEYESKIADYESRLATSAVEQTDAWRTQVASPTNEIDALVARLSVKYKDAVDSTALRGALNSDGDDRSDKIAAASAEMNEYDRNLFFQAAYLQDQVSAVSKSMRENAAGTLTQLSTAQREAQARSEQLAKAEWDAAAPRAWERVAEMAPVLEESEGADDWNAAIGKAKTFATTVKYSDLGVTEQAEVLHRAAAFPLVNSMVRALEKEVAILRDANAKYKGASPSAGGSATAPAGGGRTADSIGSDVGFTDAVDRKFREAGL